MRLLASLVAGVVLGAALIGGGGILADRVAGTPTGDVARNVMELSTGASLELLKVEDRGSLDRVVLSNGDNVVDTFITEDGEYIVQNPVPVRNFTRTLEERNAFISCLSGNDAQFFGIVTQNQTFAQHTRMAQLQMQVLGGTTNIQDVFGGPGEGQVRQAVLQNGVVWQFGDEFRAGIKTVPQLENATGCSFDPAS